MVSFTYEGGTRTFVLCTSVSLGMGESHVQWPSHYIDASWIQLAVSVPVRPGDNQKIDLQVNNLRPSDPFDGVFDVAHEHSVYHCNVSGSLSLSGGSPDKLSTYIGSVGTPGGSLPVFQTTSGWRTLTYVSIRPGDHIEWKGGAYDRQTYLQRAKYVRGPLGCTAVVAEVSGFSQYWPGHSLIGVVMDANGQCAIRENLPGSYDSITDLGFLPDHTGSTMGSYDNPIVDLYRARDAVEHFVHSLSAVSGYYPPTEPDVDVYGLLASKCTARYKKLKSNVPATAVEAVKVIDETKSLIDGIVALKQRKPKRLLQALGNLKLSLKWGLPLTYSDLTSISQAMVHEATSTRHLPFDDTLQVTHSSENRVYPGRGALAGTTASVKYTLKTLVRNSRVAIEHPVSKWASDYNLVSLQNGWDMIPYSFVVDWLTDFSKAVNAADQTLYRVAYWDIVGSVRGKRLVVDLETPQIKALDSRFVGSLKVVIYERHVSHTLPLPSLGYLQPSVGVSQVIDGSILVSQKLT